jgi:3-isopropylmalate/(R)-2-methylmalate dehydratase small subunit
MQPFTTLRAIACPLGLENVDTDQLIPARFMSRPRSAGYGAYLLHDLRIDPATGARTGLALDAPRHAGARILVARRNFGTGSSREAAVYALQDFGFACVIAPSFGDIFASNAMKNGVLPAQVEASDAEALLAWLAASPDPTIAVDLHAQTIRAGEQTYPFAIDAVRRLQLLNGWDDLDLTRLHDDAIRAFRARLAAERPWAFPAHEGGG